MEVKIPRPIIPSPLSQGEIKFEGYLLGLLYLISVGSGIYYITTRTEEERVLSIVMVVAILFSLLFIFLVYRGFLDRKKKRFAVLGIDPEADQRELASKLRGLSFRT